MNKSYLCDQGSLLEHRYVIKQDLNNNAEGLHGSHMKTNYQIPYRSNKSDIGA